MQRRRSLRDVEPASLCREPTRTLIKNQEEPLALVEALTLEAAICLQMGMLLQTLLWLIFESKRLRMATSILNKVAHMKIVIPDDLKEILKYVESMAVAKDKKK